MSLTRHELPASMINPAFTTALDHTVPLILMHPRTRIGGEVAVCAQRVSDDTLAVWTMPEESA